MSTGLSPLTVSADHAPLLSRIADFVELTKPRIVALEAVAVVITLHIATGYGALGSVWGWPLLLSVVLGTALVAGSANALNQWLERENDARMPRTSNRPLPAARMTPTDVLAFGVLTLAMGVTTLAMFAGFLPAVISLATWLVYVAIYTPLKTRSWTNTAVGAISGAMPLGIGWTAGGGSLADPLGWSLVAVLYVWQFPHFMAIAWRYREDYAMGGYQMSTVLDPTGRWAGLQAVIGSALLLPVSWAPVFCSESIQPGGFLIAATVVGAAMLAASAAFLQKPCDVSARRLLLVSLVYLPAWLLALWVSGA